MSWWPFGKKSEVAALPPAEPEKPKKKICCACPDTKVGSRYASPARSTKEFDLSGCL
jgi:hypothetical protein